jgi:hypothetical protein
MLATTAAAVFLLLLVDLCRMVHGLTNEAVSCLEAVEIILESNAPQVMAIPVGNDINTYTSSRVRLSVSWSNIDSLLKSAKAKACITSYFIEYSVSSTIDESPDHVQHSPAIDRAKTEHSLLVEDDCRLYTILVGIVPNNQIQEDRKKLLYSRPRTTWPSGRHTVVNVFSTSAIFYWPPTCSHVISPTWQMESCPWDVDRRRHPACSRDTLRRGDGVGHHIVENLTPCQRYHFRLRAPPSWREAVPRPGEVLWAFQAGQTLPQPQIEALAGHKHLRILIDQGAKCAESAVIMNWRVTVCHTGEEAVAGNGSSMHKCINQLHQLTKADLARHRQQLVIRPLEECTLYSVAISPADDDGHPLQPGERYTSVHSTLCGGVVGVEDDDARTADDNVGGLEHILMAAVVILGLAVLVMSVRWAWTTHHDSKEKLSISSSSAYYGGPDVVVESILVSLGNEDSD